MTVEGVWAAPQMFQDLITPGIKALDRPITTEPLYPWPVTDDTLTGIGTPMVL